VHGSPAAAARASSGALPLPVATAPAPGRTFPTPPAPRPAPGPPPAPRQAAGADDAPQGAAPPAPLKRKVIIFEVRGGTDKGPDGHRKDTMPIAAALAARGWDAEVLFYSDADAPDLKAYALATADAFLMRVNPGSYPGFTEAAFLAMGRELHAAGCHALTHPDVMLSYGAKDSLVKLRDTPTGMPDTCCYYDAAEFMASFPRNLAQVGAGWRVGSGVGRRGWGRVGCGGGSAGGRSRRLR
jgi:hypothetical protein